MDIDITTNMDGNPVSATTHGQLEVAVNSRVGVVPLGPARWIRTTGGAILSADRIECFRMGKFAEREQAGKPDHYRITADPVQAGRAPSYITGFLTEAVALRAMDLLAGALENETVVSMAIIESSAHEK